MNIRPITSDDFPAVAAFLADDETHLFGRPSRVGVADVTAWLAGPDLVNDTRLPIVKHDEIVAIRFHDPKTDAALGVLVQWNCHPEVLDGKNTAITAPPRQVSPS